MLRFALASLALCSSAALAAPPVFEQVVLERHAWQVAVYAVTIADVDGEQKDDVVAVTRTASSGTASRLERPSSRRQTDSIRLHAPTHDATPGDFP